MKIFIFHSKFVIDVKMGKSERETDFSVSFLKFFVFQLSFLKNALVSVIKLCVHES